MNLSIRENTFLNPAGVGRSLLNLLTPRKEEKQAGRIGDDLGLSPNDPTLAIEALSGGNQQKVTIGRWIAAGVDTLLLFDPTRGIDVRTKRQIYLLVRELAEQGASVLYYTSELAEVPAACDRVVVIFNGRVVDILDAVDANEQTLMRAAYGLNKEQAVPA